MITAQWRTDVSQPPSQSVVNNGGHVFGYHKVMLGTSVQGYHQSTFVSLARPCGILMCRIINIDTFKCNITLVIMHSSIVNGYQMLCCTNIGELQLYLYYSISSFSAFTFCMFVTLTVLFLFLDASIVCFSKLERAAVLVS